MYESYESRHYKHWGPVSSKQMKKAVKSKIQDPVVQKMGHPRNPGAATRDDGIFTGESLQQERESSPVLIVNFRL